MTLILPDKYLPAPPLISPFSRVSAGFELGFSGNSAPSSATFPVANRAMFWPMYLEAPVTVQKVWWANGTVVSGNVDLGVYDESGRALRTTGAIAQAGTSVLQEASAWKISKLNLVSAGSSTDATSYTTASFTPGANRLVICAVENSKASTPDEPTSIVGNGITYTKLATVLFNTIASPTQRLSIWYGITSAPTTGTTVIDFGSNTQTGCAWSFTEFGGTDVSGTNGVNGIVQSVTNRSDSTTALTVTLAAFGSANNATYGAFGVGNASGIAPGTGHTEIHDVTHATPAGGLETEWRVDNDTSVDETNTSGAVGGIALELKADTSSLIVPAGVSYMAFAMDNTTGTIYRSSMTNGGFSRAMGNYDVVSSFPLPSEITYAQNAQSWCGLYGIALRSLVV